MNGDAGLHDVRIQIRIGSRQRRELFPNKGAQGPLMVSVLPLDGPPKRRMQKSGAFPMPSHKFKIGDVVTLKPAISRNVPGGTYQVTKRLPDIRPLDGNSRSRSGSGPPSYSITSSARPSSVSGKVRPSVLAVFMLMISSAFTDCCTGRSAGFSPLRIRPV
jgi:hypothetical protein